MGFFNVRACSDAIRLGSFNSGGDDEMDTEKWS